MRARRLELCPAPERDRVPALELPFEVNQLVGELAFGNREALQRAGSFEDLPGGETIVALFGLDNDLAEIRADRRERVARGLEASELRVVLVALGLPGQHALREEPLTPESDQSLRIEVLGVQRPEPQKPTLSRSMTSGRFIT